MRTEQDTQNLALSGRSHSDDLALTTDDESAEGKQKGLNPRPIIRLVLRNILLLLGPAILCGAGAFALSLSAPRSYEGSFELLVEPITSQGRSTDPSALTREGGRDDTNSIDYPTLLQVLQSPELLKRISAQIRPRYPEVTENSLSREILQKTLVIGRVGTNILDSTRTIQVSYTGSDPEKVKFVLEKFAESYLRFSLEDRKNRIGGGVGFIEDQLPALQQRVNSLEAKVQSLKQRYRLTDPEAEGGALSEQFRDVQAQKLETQQQLTEQVTLYNTLRQQLGLSPEQGLAAAALSQNPRYQDLLNQLEKIDSQIAIKQARFNNESPVVSALIDQQRNIQQLILREAQTTLGMASPNVQTNSRIFAFQDAIRIALIQQLVQAGNSSQAIRARGIEIAQTEAFLDQQLRQFPAIVRQYNDLKQQLDIATRTLNQFLLQRETLRVEAAQKEVPWEVISQPNVLTDAAGKPVASVGKAKMYPILGLGAGLFLGLLLALLLEKIRDIFFNADDIRDAVQFPYLGTIPMDKGVRAISPASSFGGGLKPVLSDKFQDALSALYTDLRFLDSGKSLRSLAIGSTGVGDGKTTIALHLAQTAAAMGQKVLLVDANLRSPQLHSILGVPNDEGLMDLLNHRIEQPEKVIRTTSLDSRLSVLPAGSITPNATKLLAATEMKQLVNRLSGMFDLVIYDTPHLHGLTDTNFLAAATDGILMVVGVKKTKKSAFFKAVEGLKRYRIPVLGIVANHPGKGSAPINTQAEQSDSVYQEHPALFGNLKALRTALPDSAESGDMLR
ncbi:GumC family protein [Pantanalinema sp. GBBB05]|uniref:GumC family protein n=1 Tax=Pantanalinema sp. GBBB05 TaxID=2604139 RepID=UPI001DA71143|nr:polysaccharide biosynthesis tyrosine autokinase [Pantanalinema sp. GBBB05]